MYRFTLRSLLLVLALAVSGISVSAQALPEQIRGYKVRQQVLTLSNTGPERESAPYIKLGTPTVSDVSFGGVTIAIVGELESAGYDGRVEMMSFDNFTVNKIPITIDEFSTQFSIRKKGRTALPEPASVFLPTTRLLDAAWKEITDSKAEWTITGRVFVFGKFRKFGFSFKRVIPVDVRLVVKNPLAEYRKAVNG